VSIYLFDPQGALSDYFSCRCPGQPAFEITKFVKIDPQNGEVDISPDFR